MDGTFKTYFKRRYIQQVSQVVILCYLSLATPKIHGQYTITDKDVFFKKLVAAAMERTEKNITYDPAYYQMDYPNGDIPEDKGVCTDVIIRVYRKLGVDLQKEIHENIESNFTAYPNRWGLTQPDANIDHRRVLNIATFFQRAGAELTISKNPDSYIPGDVITWDIGGGIMHIGIVVELLSEDGKRNMIVHNIGAGPVAEDILFKYRITGHFRYYKKVDKQSDE